MPLSRTKAPEGSVCQDEYPCDQWEKGYHQALVDVAHYLSNEGHLMVAQSILDEAITRRSKTPGA